MELHYWSITLVGTYCVKYSNSDLVLVSFWSKAKPFPTFIRFLLLVNETHLPHELWEHDLSSFPFISNEQTGSDVWSCEFPPSATLSSTTVIFSSSSSRFFRNLTNTPLVKPLELSSKASASWQLHGRTENTQSEDVYPNPELKTHLHGWSRVQPQQNVRRVAEDNVGCDSQDDIWHAVIVNVPEKEERVQGLKLSSQRWSST